MNALAESCLPLPGPVWGLAPERDTTDGTRGRVLAASLRPYQQRISALARAACKIESRSRLLSADELPGQLRRLRHDLRRQGLTAATMSEAVGAVSAVACNALGIDVYATQRHAALVLLDGRLAEMATGEGKTLTVALAAGVAALAGTPVHVITANDYLVHRDAMEMAPLYEALGLRVGCITADLPRAARVQPYGAHVVYCTAKELVFDYLRDGLAAGGRGGDLQRRAAALAGFDDQVPPLLRGLCMAIIDEADSILIDEATVPLVISRENRQHDRRAFLWQSLAIAGQMTAGRDFTVHGERVELMPAGDDRLAAATAGLRGPWRRRRYAREAIRLALTAQHLLHRDEDYLLRDDRVLPLDAVTGRAAPGRVWSRGLHTLLELKEGCAITPESETVGRTTYQQFFPRYLKLCGMSGSLAESRRELHAVYGLRVARVPLRTPCVRRNLGTRVFLDVEARWRAVVERTHNMQSLGRPVLVGVDSIEDASVLSGRLTEAGIDHTVLHAHNDAQEAGIIARAGEPGQVTVATRMAGRGTDIRLGHGVAAAGGLHVINCQWNASRRLDRQLAGRAGRQGDPGSLELCHRCDAHRGIWRQLTSQFAGRSRTPTGMAPVISSPAWLVRLAAAWLKRRLESRAERSRRNLLQQEMRWARQLTFSTTAP